MYITKSGGLETGFLFSSDVKSFDVKDDCEMALPVQDFAYLIPYILLYMLLATSLKKAYIRHYGELL